MASGEGEAAPRRGDRRAAPVEGARRGGERRAAPVEGAPRGGERRAAPDGVAPRGGERRAAPVEVPPRGGERRAAPVAGGDARARFDSLYAAHRDDVWRYLRRRSARDIEDLTTEVFLVAWRRRAQVPGEPLPWLYGVARKVLANHRRGAARREALAERAAAHTVPAVPDHAEGAGLRADLARALATLSERDRELVLLVAWEGLTIAEAATALGCRRGAAAVRLHRARRRLHAALNDESRSLAAMTALEER